MADDAASHLRYIQYESDKENEYVSAMRQLISKDLSEPYSIYVYRYFLYQWGDLCYMVNPRFLFDIPSPRSLPPANEFPVANPVLLHIQAMDGKDNLIGVVISKLEPHRGGPLRGYIAMLAVREEYRGQGIATTLVRMAIDAMIARDADEVCYCSSSIFYPSHKHTFLPTPFATHSG